MIRFRLTSILFISGCVSSSSKSTATGHLDFIQPFPYTDLLIEVYTVGDITPDENVLSQVTEGIALLLNKPVMIQLDEQFESRGEDHVWTNAELEQLHNDSFNLLVDESVIKIHSLIVDGRYGSTTSQQLGYAWGSNRIAMFRQTLAALCASTSAENGAQRRTLCRIAATEVWIHEIGHVLGLVDNGLKMVEDHVDIHNGHHDIDPECIMYWATEQESLISRIEERLAAGDEGIQWFCSKCLQRPVQTVEQ